MSWIFFLLAAASLLVGAKRDYTGYKVLEINGRDVSDQKWERFQEAYLHYNHKLEYLQEPTKKRPFEVFGSAAQLRRLKDGLVSHNIQHRTIIDDVQKSIDAEEMSLNKARRRRDVDSDEQVIDGFPTLQQIEEWLNKQQAKYPNLTKLTDIGMSFELRQMRLFEVGAENETRNKPVIWIDSAIHSREWIAPTALNYVIQKLLSGYATSETIKKLVDSFHWVFLPIANPDGYVFSHTHDRLWRKTRSRYFDTLPSLRNICIGVDANRNFPFHWKDCPESSRLCASSHCDTNTYAGKEAGSEIEVRNMVVAMLALRKRALLYLSFHSASQQLLVPWGYTTKRPQNIAQINKLAELGVQAMHNASGATYQIGAPPFILYAAAGTSYDYAKGAAGFPYSYTVEISPNRANKHRFTLPQNMIKPAVEGVWACVQAMAQKLLNQQDMNHTAAEHAQVLPSTSTVSTRNSTTVAATSAATSLNCDIKCLVVLLAFSFIPLTLERASARS